MKKIFNMTIPIGVLFLLLALLLSFHSVSGAATRTLNGVEVQNEIEQDGTPWLDLAWHYRQPVVINSGVSKPWYQVLIALNSSNFNFSHASLNGKDVRFTHSDGETQLSYWIESWDNSHQLAYVWVKIPGLANGVTTIYLYYNNPIATSQSNGPSTFDSFDDDWCAFPGAGCVQRADIHNPESAQGIESLFTWEIIGASPSVTPTIPGFLNIWEGRGIKSTASYIYQAIGFRANFGLGGEYERAGFLNHLNGQGTMIGDDCPSTIGDIFLINSGNCAQFSPQDNWHNTYHVYEVRWRSGQSSADIDHRAYNASSTNQVPSTSLPVTLYSYQDSNATLKMDWVYVRQFLDPEPIATTNKNDEQGLVELGISNIDSPDPLITNAELSYLLTIYNNSLIDASGVVVTDTLPGSVQFVRADPPQGCSHLASNVVCSLNTIAANSTISVTIVVNPTVDGVITNTAKVGSPGFELGLSNNTSEAVTLVAVPPTVAWVKPVENRQSYLTYGGIVTLEASAADNDQIARVEFWRYDGSAWVYINTDYSSPYLVPFDTTVLVPNQQYPVEVYAFDRAGNQNALKPEDIRQVIYIKRLSLRPIYLPLTSK